MNKLAPKSELMTYLGNAPGGKGWKFMHIPNNIIFTSAHATFDETLFPKCPLAIRRQNTRVHSPAPNPLRALCLGPSTCGKGKKHCHCPPPVDEDPNLEPSSSLADKKGKGRAPSPVDEPDTTPSDEDGEGDHRREEVTLPEPGPSV